MPAGTVTLLTIAVTDDNIKIDILKAENIESRSDGFPRDQSKYKKQTASFRLFTPNENSGTDNASIKTDKNRYTLNKLITVISDENMYIQLSR